MALFIKLCVLLMIICFTGEAVVLSAARLTYRDPFISYTAIMPGQSIDALRDYPCQFRIIPETTVALGACQFPKGYGVFRKVALTAVDHMITKTSAYDIQPNALHLGDLMLCWGEPTMYGFDPPGYFTPSLGARWGSSVYTSVEASYHSLPSAYFLPVSLLSLADEAPPCRSAQ